MKTTELGRLAEEAAKERLVAQGYEIIDRNWRTRLCEIDIIAKRQAVVYFCEVKFRRDRGQGGGLDYVTGSKQRQMRFAGELWTAEHDWAGDWRLMAVEVAPKGGGLVVSQVVELD